MGWKSTIEISREEAISLISQRSKDYNELTNHELEYMLYDLDYGDNTDLPYYGYNFTVTETGKDLDF